MDFAPLNVSVLVAVSLMVAAAAMWHRRGRAHLDQLAGGLKVLRRLSQDLPPDHPVRRRLESAPVVELALEEIVELVRGEDAEPAARGLLALQLRAGWIDRFGQFAVHLGILGTVVALMLVDATDMDAFRSQLPVALGTTFWGLVGALILGAIGGAVESLLEQARLVARQALLASFGSVSTLEPGPDGLGDGSG